MSATRTVLTSASMMLSGAGFTAAALGFPALWGALLAASAAALAGAISRPA